MFFSCLLLSFSQSGSTGASFRVFLTFSRKGGDSIGKEASLSNIEFKQDIVIKEII